MFSNPFLSLAVTCIVAYLALVAWECVLWAIARVRLLIAKRRLRRAIRRFHEAQRLREDL